MLELILGFKKMPQSFTFLSQADSSLTKILSVPPKIFFRTYFEELSNILWRAWRAAFNKLAVLTDSNSYLKTYVKTFKLRDEQLKNRFLVEFELSTPYSLDQWNHRTQMLRNRKPNRARPSITETNCKKIKKTIFENKFLEIFPS